MASAQGYLEQQLAREEVANVLKPFFLSILVCREPCVNREDWLFLNQGVLVPRYKPFHPLSS